MGWTPGALVLMGCAAFSLLSAVLALSRRRAGLKVVIGAASLAGVAALTLSAGDNTRSPVAERLVLMGLGGSAVWLLVPSRCRLTRVTASAQLATGAALGVWLSLSPSRYAAAPILLGLGSGLLLPACVLLGERHTRDLALLTNGLLACALVLQCAELVAAGVRGQALYGAYWSWSPPECWRLAACVTTGIAWLTVRAIERGPWRAMAVTLVAWFLGVAATLVLIPSWTYCGS